MVEREVERIREKLKVIKEIANLLSCSQEEVVERVEKLVEEVKKLRSCVKES